ncbi:MAG: hypothetical protein ACRDSZ_24815 [Pseudonocardiaceae bacterium]
MESWLNNSAAPAILRELAGLPLTHHALDALPAGKAVEHLRSVLVAISTLPPRDEHMSRLERWIDRAITERVDPQEQHLLRRYGVWHLLRRLRGRAAATGITHSQALGVRQHIKAAIAVLDWLAAHNLALPTAGQGDLEAWLVSEHAIQQVIQPGGDVLENLLVVHRALPSPEAGSSRANACTGTANRDRRRIVGNAPTRINRHTSDLSTPRIHAVSRIEKTPDEPVPGKAVLMTDVIL